MSVSRTERRRIERFIETLNYDSAVFVASKLVRAIPEVMAVVALGAVGDILGLHAIDRIAENVKDSKAEIARLKSETRILIANEETT